MLANGEMDKRMVWENFISLMAVLTVGTLKMELQKVKADLFILMVTFMLENGKMIRLMGMDLIIR